MRPPVVMHFTALCVELRKMAGTRCGSDVAIRMCVADCSNFPCRRHCLTLATHTAFTSGAAQGYCKAGALETARARAPEVRRQGGGNTPRDALCTQPRGEVYLYDALLLLDSACMI